MSGLWRLRCKRRVNFVNARVYYAFRIPVSFVNKVESAFLTRRLGGYGMSETKRTKNIAFRVTDEDYARIEKAATAAGDDPNNWCRKAAVGLLSAGHTFTQE